MNRLQLVNVIACLGIGAAAACSSSMGHDGGPDAPSSTDASDATAADTSLRADVQPDAQGDADVTDAGPALDAADGSTGVDAADSGAGSDAADVVTPIDGDGAVVASGIVYGEAVPGVDSGVPGRGPTIASAAVTALAFDGTVLARVLTDASGQYMIRVPASTTILLEVGPLADHAGLIRGEQTQDIDYMAYDLTLPLVSGLQTVASGDGTTYNPALGWISVGFNPVSHDTGGEGAQLGAGTHSAPAVNLTGAGDVVSNTLVPICATVDGGTADAGPDGGPCAATRANVVMFPDVDLGTTTVTPVDPAVGTCAERFGVPSWPVVAGVVTSVSIDCE